VHQGRLFFLFGSSVYMPFLLLRVSRTPAPPSNDAQPSSTNTTPVRSRAHRILRIVDGLQMLPSNSNLVIVW
jgi:hypothetical protein